MCSRYNVTRSPKMTTLFRQLKVAGEPRYLSDIPPGEQISIVRETAEGREFATATWWLFLNADTGKPEYRYSTFNSRWDKLDDPRSLAFHPYRKSRCIIPASAVCEGLGDRRTYHQVELEGRAIAFGGLYREYRNRHSGEVVLGASIITLPSCERFASIHPKSIPLMLDAEDESTIDRWLDPGFQDVDFFKPLLEPRIFCAQRITPIDKPSKW